MDLVSRNQIKTSVPGLQEIHHIVQIIALHPGPDAFEPMGSRQVQNPDAEPFRFGD